VDYLGFLRSVERGQIPAVALIHGADAQLLDDAQTAVTRAVFPEPAHAVFDRDVFDGRTVDVEAIVNAALTLPLGAPRRLVVVRHSQGLPAKGADTLARYAANPNPSACLLLLADEPLGPTRDRKPHWLLATLPAAATVELVLQRGRAVIEWLRERAAAEGLQVSDEAARLLVQWVGEDTATLLGEARKAALAGGPDNRTVGVKDIEAVVGEHRVSAIFELTRAIERREIGLALRTLERLLATEDALPVLVALAREMRMMATVRQWRSDGRSIDQIARMLGRPPVVAEALATAAATESAATIGRKLGECWRTEHRLKTGGEPRAEMAALVVELCRTA
jgi:DNA polymerase-3 subunit delta